MKSSVTISACVLAAVGYMTAGNALASEGLDECLQRFAERHVPEGTPVVVADSAKIEARQLRARGEERLTADLVTTPGDRPFGSVTCVLNRHGKLRLMYADLR